MHNIYWPRDTPQRECQKGSPTEETPSTRKWGAESFTNVHVHSSAPAFTKTDWRWSVFHTKRSANSMKLRSSLPDGLLTNCWKAATVGFFLILLVFLDFPISRTPRSHHRIKLLHDGVNCDRTSSIILVILLSIQAVNHPNLFHISNLVIWGISWESLKLWTGRHHLHAVNEDNTSCKTNEKQSKQVSDR